MPTQHSSPGGLPISPSNLPALLLCAGKPQAEAEYPPEPSSIHAERGTWLHNVAEYCLRNGLEPADEMGPDEWEDVYAVERCTTYAQAEWAVRYEGQPGAVRAYESRVYMPTIHPELYGTADVAYFIPGQRGTIIDFKFGSHPVDAQANAQLAAYAIGLATAHDLQSVRAVIIQPADPERHIKKWDLHANALRYWGDALATQVQRAMEPNPPRTPDPGACRWCRARGGCRKRLTHELKTIFHILEPTDA